jgi:hypothetical protein
MWSKSAYHSTAMFSVRFDCQVTVLSKRELRCIVFLILEQFCYAITTHFQYYYTEKTAFIS